MLDLLELELQAIVSHLSWVLETELKSSGKIGKGSDPVLVLKKMASIGS